MGSAFCDLMGVACHGRFYWCILIFSLRIVPLCRLILFVVVFFVCVIFVDFVEAGLKHSLFTLADSFIVLQTAMVSRRDSEVLRFLELNYKPVASCRDGVLYVQPVAPYNVFGVRARKIVCLSQTIYLRPEEAKALLKKGEQGVCPAMPGDPPESHRHSWRQDDSDTLDSEGPTVAEIALLYVKWRMRLVVVKPPYLGGGTKERGRALEEVLDYLGTRQIPAAGFIESLRANYRFAAIKFSMDTAIAACMRTGDSWPAAFAGPAATLGFERATWGPRLRVLARPEREGEGEGGLPE
jgi:hypothetical protein